MKRALFCSGFSFLVLFLVSVASMAAEAPLTQRYGQTLLGGDIAQIGNAIVECDSADPDCVTARLNGQPSNSFTMSHIDVDTDGATFNSSSSVLTIPANAQIQYAGLYWTATFSSSSVGSIDPPDVSQRTNVLFSTPATAAYVPLTGTLLGDTTTNDDSYGAFADVTALVQAGGSGTYTTANIQVTTGDGSTGPWGGWSLAVVYIDPLSQQCRNVNVFDGYNNFFFAQESITVTGFEARAQAPVSATIGFFMGDGDIQNMAPNDATDTVLLNGTIISNAENPVDNFFNNNITVDGVNVTSNTPSYDHNLVMDVDVLTVSGLIAPGDTSAVITIDSGEGLWWPMATIAIDAVCPTLEIVKTSNTSIAGQKLEPGELITYDIVVTNLNNIGAATEVSISDVLPTGVTYVGGSATKTYNVDSAGTAGSYTSRVFPSTDFDISLTQTHDTTGLIPAGATLTDYELTVTGSTVDWLSELSMVASIPSGPVFTLASGVAPFNVNGSGSFNETRSGAFSGMAEGVYQFLWEDSGDTITTDENTVSSAVFTIDYVYDITRVSHTVAAGAPPNLVTAADAITLLPGESLTVSYQVMVDDPLADGISQLTNTASAVSVQTPVPIIDTVVDYIILGQISGRVWLDEDQDGVLDIEETGITNATVHLCSSPVASGECDPTDPEYLESVNTDQNGDYSFNNLLGGDYQIAVDDSSLPVDLSNTAGQYGVDPRTVTLPEDGKVVDQLFGYIADPNTGIIGDRVWIDADGDGVQDPGEPGLSGLTLQLLDSQGNPVLDGASMPIVATTTADGDYFFTGLPLDMEYLVSISPTAPQVVGFTPTSGPQSEGGYISNPITLTMATPTVTDADFGFNSPSANNSLSDTVWLDADGNTLINGDEGGISGVTVNLYQDANMDGIPDDLNADGQPDVIATTISDANGDVTFTGLVDGSYVVGLSDNLGTLDGLNSTTTSAASGFSPTVTLSGGASSDLDSFGFNQPGKIAGVVYSDANNDGNQDGGEPGFTGTSVTLYEDTDGDGVYETVITTVYTQSDGSYEFKALPPGDYEVVVTPPGGVQTEDPDAVVNNATQVTLSNSVESSIHNDFGYFDSSLNSVNGTVFLDTDKDGVRELNGVDEVLGTADDETGFGGVTIELVDQSAILYDIINGMVDINGDGVVDANDDGTAGGIAIIDSNFDMDGDGDIDEDDNGSVGPYTVLAGMIKIDGGTATQSSTGFEGDADPNVGIDNDPTGGTGVGQGPFIHTLGSIGTDYWEVDLGSQQSIGTIKVFNRDDGSQSRLENVRVMVSDTPFPADPADYAGAIANSDFTYQILASDLNDPNILVGGITGRYVRLQKSGTDNVTNFLNFAEVKITPAFIAASATDVIATTVSSDGTTDANGDGMINALDLGFYEFDGLEDGDYTVRVTDDSAMLAGYDITSGLDQRDVTVAGADVKGIDFGYIKDEATGSISGEVFIEETNFNGLADEAETNLANVIVYLCSSPIASASCDSGDPEYIGQTLTDVNGEYVFTDLPAGSYVVDTEPSSIPSDLTLSVEPATVALSEGEDITDVDIGYVPAAGTAVLSGFVWTDVSSDGVFQQGEAPIAGVRINVSDGTTGAVIATVLTGPDGSWIITGISGADIQDNLIVSYDASTVPSSLVSSQPTNLPLGDDLYNPVNLLSDPDNNISYLDFAFPPTVMANLGSISGTIYSDADQNGDYSSTTDGELQNVTVNLYNGAGELVATTHTDENGNYSFVGLVDDATGYQVVVTDVGNVLQDLNPLEIISNPIVIAGGADITGQDAGFISDQDLGSIGNRFFFDSNGDGILQDDEPGIAGVTLQLWLDVDASETPELADPSAPGYVRPVPQPGIDNLVRTVTTDANGEYYFTSLPEGQYIVVVVDANGFVEVNDAVLPASPTTADGYAKPWAYTITKTDASPNFTADFAVTGSNEISGKVFIEDETLVDPDLDGTVDPNVELDGSTDPTGGSNPNDVSGDSPAVGVTVVLYRVLADGTEIEVQTTVTDANGDYSFSGLPDGDYRVEVMPSGSPIDGFGQTGDPDLVANSNGNGNEDLVCDSPTSALCDDSTLVSVSGSGASALDFGYRKNFVTTPVTVNQFSATTGVSPSEVKFYWETSNEVGHLGYQLYARGDDDWVLLNDVLIVNETGGDALQTRHYEFSANSDAQWFALVDVSAAEELTIHGPFQRGANYGEIMVEPAEFDWSGISIDAGQDKQELSASVNARIQMLRELSSANDDELLDDHSEVDEGAPIESQLHSGGQY